jgi:transposase
VVAPVQAAYEKALGRSVHPSLVYRALHRPGGRKVVPRPKHPKSSEEAREAFKKVTGDRARASSGAGRCHGPAAARVRRMFEDEARLGRSSDPRRCWAPVGVRPAVEVQVGREYEYAFAAVSPHDGVLDTLVLPTAKAAALSVFLAAVAQRHPDEFVLMALDGAGWHRAKRLQVPAHRRRIPLPPGSPQLNPVEHLWDEVREKWFSNRVFASLSAMDEQLVKALLALEVDPRQVASLTGFPWITNIPLKAH